MWFRNLRAYRLKQPFNLTAEQLETQLASGAFTPCAPSQPLSLGWTSPLGSDDGPLVHAGAGRLLLRMRREERLLPATVVREQLGERVAAIEAKEGRKVYRKERLTLKDEIVQDCLPKAFTRSSFLHAFIDPAGGWIYVDTTSASRAEEFLNLLRDNVGTFPVELPDVRNAPQASMTRWLLQRDLPAGFDAAGECELREPGEDGGVVRCRGVDLFSEEVDSHLHAGRQVARLALRYDERVAFVLGDDLSLRRLKFADALLKENEDLPPDDALARLDADFVLMAEALVELLEAVFKAFGGPAE